MMAEKRQARRASPARKVSDARLRAALVKHDGLIARAATEVGLTRQSVHERVNNNPELLEFVQDLRESMVDAAVGVLSYRMKRYHCRQSAEFVLKHHGRDRGYGPQPEIPPPPPDDSRRMTIIRELVKMMDERAAAMHVRPVVDITPVLNGHASPARQLLDTKERGEQTRRPV